MRSDQAPICSFRQIIFPGARIKVGEIALRVGVTGRKFHASLDLRNGVVFLPLRREYAPQLEMNAGVIGPFSGQPAQQWLGIAQPARLHINVGEADRGVRRVGVKRQRLFVLRLSVGKFFSLLMQQPSRKMRLGIFRHKLGSFAVRLERVFRLGIFQQMSQREPGAGLTFFDVIVHHVIVRTATVRSVISRRVIVCRMARGFERSGRAQKSFGLGTIQAGQHQAQIQVRLKNVGLGGDRLPVRVDRVVNAVEAIENKSQIEPRLIVLGILVDGLLQQRFRAGEIVFLDGIFSLRDFRRLSSMGPCNGERWCGLAQRQPAVRQVPGEARTAAENEPAFLPGRCGALTSAPATDPSAHDTISVQHLLQVLSSVRALQLRDRFRRARSRPGSRRDRRLPDQDR